MKPLLLFTSSIFTIGLLIVSNSKGVFPLSRLATLRFYQSSLPTEPLIISSWPDSQCGNLELLKNQAFLNAKREFCYELPGDSVGSVRTHLYSVNIRQWCVREQVSSANSLDWILIMNGSSGTTEHCVDQINTWIDAINNKDCTFSLSSWRQLVTGLLTINTWPCSIAAIIRINEENGLFDHTRWCILILYIYTNRREAFMYSLTWSFPLFFLYC